jgi:cell division protein FtsL
MATKKKTVKKSKAKIVEEVVVPVEAVSEVSGGGLWSNVRLFFVTVLICAVVFAAGYIYLWVQNFRNLQAESKAAITKQEQLEVESQDLSAVRIKIQEQVSNCNNLIMQGSGDFSQFEYCKKFIEWSRSLPQSVVK